MPEFNLSSHARAMMQERGIDEAWLWRTLEIPVSSLALQVSHNSERRKQ